MSDLATLIDLSSIAYPYWHLSGSEPDPDWSSTQIVRRIRAITSGAGPVGIFCDHAGSFRRDLSPIYKANRPDHDARCQHQIANAAATLEEDGFPIYIAPGFEADDLIATAVAQIPEGPILIVSADKDLLQLVNDRVQVFRPGIGGAPERTYDPHAVFEKFCVTPAQMVDFQALVGDPIDNIIGAQGIGPKRAAGLLKTFGTAANIWAAVQKGEAALTPALVTSLMQFFLGEPSRFALARDLVRLRADAPITIEQMFVPRVPVDAGTLEDDELARGIAQDIEDAMPTLDPEAEMTERTGPHERPDPEAETTERPVGEERAAPEAETTEGTSTRERPAEREERTGPVERPAACSEGTEGGERVEAAIEERTVARERVEPEVIPAVNGRAPVEWGRQLEPASMTQAQALSLWMFRSRLFSGYGSEHAVLAAILAGRELGIQALASLRAFHIIEGKPTLSSAAIHTLVLNSGKAEYFRCTARTADYATFVTKRKGDADETSLTFTVAEAKQAWSKESAKFATSGWGRNPADMCVARALTKLARLVYPDVLLGMYATEEFDA